MDLASKEVTIQQGDNEYTRETTKNRHWQSNMNFQKKERIFMTWEGEMSRVGNRERISRD